MFKPLCIAGEKVIGHSASGWLIPCCWLDPNGLNIIDKNISMLFKDELKIENVDSIEDIILSDEWINFMKILQSNDDDKIPLVCKKKCSNTPKSKIKMRNHNV